MLRTDLLIDEARQATENVEFTTETGVQDSEYIRALNDAQDRIQSLILNAYPRMFQKQKVIDAVKDQETYDIPVDVFMDSRIEKLEYSINRQLSGYYKLDAGVSDERLNSLSGNPSFYIRESKTVMLEPPPIQTGLIRFTYQRSFPRLDKRRGKVSAVTLDGTTKTITTLTLDPTILTDVDISLINKVEYICIVARDGRIKMKGIPVVDVNSSTGDITVDTFSYEDGESIAVGDYAVAGKYTTTHSELPDICERYLLRFTEWRILKRDSSNDALEEDKELQKMEAEIVESYRQADNDVKEVPVLDSQYLDSF